jgi:hypothetical protein
LQGEQGDDFGEEVAFGYENEAKQDGCKFSNRFKKYLKSLIS